MLVALTTQCSWKLCYMNMKIAFLNGDLEQEAYILKLCGTFEVLRKKHMVCKLLKTLYDLKQAPLPWSQKID
jgi:hypothetical protein